MGDTDKSAGKQILRASYVSVIGNGVLSAAKIIAGALSGSFAVISDGIDSASDVAMSVVMIVTAKIMGRKPNRKYVYGYAKAELIATKILSMLIFLPERRCLFQQYGIFFRSRNGYCRAGWPYM